MSNKTDNYNGKTKTLVNVIGRMSDVGRQATFDGEKQKKINVISVKQIINIDFFRLNLKTHLHFVAHSGSI